MTVSTAQFALYARRFLDRQVRTENLAAVPSAQGPILAAAFGTQVSNAAWKTKPSWYIVAKLDEAIPPDEERFFAKRANATTTELNTSHLAMLAKPADVAAIILARRDRALGVAHQ